MQLPPGFGDLPPAAAVRMLPGYSVNLGVYAYFGPGDVTPLLPGLLAANLVRIGFAEPVATSTQD